MPEPEGPVSEDARGHQPAAAGYRDKYVAFVDILGFAELVREADKDEDRLAAVVDALNTVSTVAPPSHAETGLMSQNFSDSLILSAHATPDGLWHLLLTLDRLSWNLLCIGILARGGVAHGRIHHDEKIVFGVGVNEAYRLESTVAKFPRIIVSRHVFKNATDYATSNEVANVYLARLIRDDDGVWFINYLSDLEAFAHQNAPTDELRKSSWYSAGEVIREQLQRQLDEMIDRPEVYAKLAWMANYWNRRLTDNEAGRVMPFKRLVLAGETDPDRPLPRRALPFRGI